MTFSQAIDLMRIGYVCRRKAWPDGKTARCFADTNRFVMEFGKFTKINHVFTSDDRRAIDWERVI